MKWMKQHWRGMFRAVSTLLLCAGAFCGYWWFYKLAPSRRTLSPEWYLSHSEQEYWREVQKGIHRGMWFHDDGFTVGMYGDKSWSEWIMAHVKPGTSMGCIGGGPCHSASSMRYITNQDVGEDADAWLDWWEDNKSKSQEEWMADGFRLLGFDIDVPPTAEQTPILLALLGNSETNELRAIPKEMKYNAFRCLRDSGFEPVAFALSHRTVSEEVERGLLEYAKKERHWPARNGVGILSFGQKDVDLEGHALPAMLEPSFQIRANALVFGPPLLGAALLICSFRKRMKNVEPDAPPNDGPATRLGNSGVTGRPPSVT
jgi:hypothetical protein